MDTATIRARLGDLRWMVQQAQADRPPWNATKARYQASMATIMDQRLGPLLDVADQIEGALDPEAPPGEPESPGEPPPQFVAPIPEGAVYGMQKWYQGPDSPYGVDMFCPRGTPVYAPCDALVEEVVGGTGLQGGAELILSAHDYSWAFRYRHIQAQVQVGQTVRQGQQVALVGDDSLLALGNPPAWSQPMPDQYQHLDLSVNQGTDRFTPTGGAGGNTSAYSWLVSINYRGRVLARTPGPPDAGH